MEKKEVKYNPEMKETGQNSETITSHISWRAFSRQREARLSCWGDMLAEKESREEICGFVFKEDRNN